MQFENITENKINKESGKLEMCKWEMIEKKVGMISNTREMNWEVNENTKHIFEGNLERSTAWTRNLLT